MPKRKVAASGFGLLMKELQEKNLKEGRKYSMSQMKDIADPVWKRMSQEERNKYTQNAKATRRLVPTEKLASDGTSIQRNTQLIEEKEVEQRDMALGIREFVNGNEQDVHVFKSLALKQVYYIMSFNILCCTEEDEYYPLEIAIVEYSIHQGILRHYHKFIHPGRVPPGFTGEAKRHSESTHQIPFSGHEDSEKDYVRIMEEVENFLCPPGYTDDEFPPVFTLRNAMEQTSGCLAWLARRANCTSYPRVWDVSYLLYELRFGVGHDLHTITIAEDILMKNTFDYTSDSRCDFHEELDSAYCALGCARRLCFLLSDCLCGVCDVEITEKHLPVRSQKTKPYEIHHMHFSKSVKPSKPELPIRPCSPPGLPLIPGTHIKCSELDGFDDSDQDIDLDYNPSKPSTKSQVPSSAFAQMKLSGSTVAPGQGFGRGRPCNM